VKLEHAVALAGLIVLLLLCAVSAATWLIARHYYAPDQIDEKPAAMVWHDDGSLTPIRAKNGGLKLPPASAPKGGTPTRTIEFTVKPDPIPADKVAEHTNAAGDVECAPITVRADTHEYTDGPDKGLRTSLRADGGDLLDGVEVPHTTVLVHDVKRNIVGIDIAGDRKTLKYGRALGPVDLGIQVSEESGRLDQGGWIQFRF